MYYYYDDYNKYQGPFSRKAFEIWFDNNTFPEGRVLYDEDGRPSTIEDVVGYCVEGPTNNESTFLEKTVDMTNPDVTLNLSNDQNSRIQNSTTDSDFTQIEEGVDEIDGASSDSDNDSDIARICKLVEQYLTDRPIHNETRVHSDNYIPFELPWNGFAIQRMSLNDAYRSAMHFHTMLTKVDTDTFCKYLEWMEIQLKPCDQCGVSFKNTYKMMCHFLSIPHVSRMYENEENYLSGVDFHCMDKMIVDAMQFDENTTLNTKNSKIQPKESFFDTTNVTVVFESFKSTSALYRAIPLFFPTKDELDTCDYIEALLLFRSLENRTRHIKNELLTRRIGGNSDMHCAYCNQYVDTRHLSDTLRHILSEEHVEKALERGVCRSQMEYWQSFLNALIRNQTISFGEPLDTIVSLQEDEFPLCSSVCIDQSDFVYAGIHVESILEEIREKVRHHYATFRDAPYRTTCRLCKTRISTEHGVICHILYDEVHVKRISRVSNAELRRFCEILQIQCTLPLFRLSLGQVEAVDPKEKLKKFGKIRDSYRRIIRNRVSTKSILRNSWPMGLVNWCELCECRIEDASSIIPHMLSDHHQEIAIKSPLVSSADFQYWTRVLNKSFRN